MIDLNCDIGESENTQDLERDFELLKYISSCNVACGFHAGSPQVISQTINHALKEGVKVGAHPSFDDRPNFGRVEMEISEAECRALMGYQIAAIYGMVSTKGGTLHHVKPHGALYNKSAREIELTRYIYESIKAIDPGLSVYGFEGTVHEQVAQELGLNFIPEAFGDRGYNDDGSLVNRKLEGAMITDKDVALERVMGIMDRSEIVSITGTHIPSNAKTICFHSDSDNSLEMVKYVHEYLSA